MANRLNQALNSAKEYRRLMTMGDVTLAGERRRDIEDLVGYRDADLTFRLPREVEAAMGIDPWTTPSASTWSR
jgi:hypothetical protein